MALKVNLYSVSLLGWNTVLENINVYNIKATPQNLVRNSRGKQGGVKDTSTRFYSQVREAKENLAESIKRIFSVFSEETNTLG